MPIIGGHEAGTLAGASPWAIYQSSLTRRGTLITVNARVDRTAGSAVVGEQFGLLPAGFRPLFPIGCGAIAFYAASGWMPAGVIVTAAGEMSLYGTAGATSVIVSLAFTRA